MHRLAGFECQVDGVGERFIREERAGADCAVDAGIFLVHHPPGAEVEMADFRIAHLAGRQPDGGLRGVNQGMGVLFPEPVPHRFAGSGDGVVLGILAIAPSIQNDQNQGFRGE